MATCKGFREDRPCGSHVRSPLGYRRPELEAMAAACGVRHAELLSISSLCWVVSRLKKTTAARVIPEKARAFDRHVSRRVHVPEAFLVDLGGENLPDDGEAATAEEVDRLIRALPAVRGNRRLRCRSAQRLYVRRLLWDPSAEVTDDLGCAPSVPELRAMVRTYLGRRQQEEDVLADMLTEGVEEEKRQQEEEEEEEADPFGDWVVPALPATE